MGQKVHPVGMRLGITSDWDSNWFSEKDFQAQLLTDIKVRKYLFDNLKEGAISHIKIERPAKNARIKILAGKPGAIIGQKGKGVEKLRDEASRIMGVPVHLTIEEVRKPELDAFLVADNVARQLEQRVMFRRAMKRAVQSALRSGALGVKICVSGRLGGAEIARSEWTREGRVPLHTFRADIDYALAEALTTYGIIGVKVWIFKGEKVAHAPKKIEEKVE